LNEDIHEKPFSKFLCLNQMGRKHCWCPASNSKKSASPKGFGAADSSAD